MSAHRLLACLPSMAADGSTPAADAVLRIATRSRAGRVDPGARERYAETARQ